MVRLDLYFKVITGVFFLYLFLGYSAQIITIGGIPIAEMLLIIGVAIIIATSRLYLRESILLPFYLLILTIFAITALRLTKDVQDHGIFAIRDASHYIDMLALLIAARIGKSRLNDIASRAHYIAILCLLYFALYFFRENSPVIYNPHGVGVYLLNYVAFPTLAISIIFSALATAHSAGNRWTILITLACLIALGMLIQIFQARLIYIQVVACACVYFMIKPTHLRYLPFALALVLPSLLLSSALGESFGRLGVGLNLETLLQHIYSIAGIGSDNFDNAASGLDLRSDWWSTIFSDISNHPELIFFGKGFGVPLTDFMIANDIQVRELHNSYLSTFARQGLPIFILVSIVWFLIFSLVLKVLLRIRKNGITSANDTLALACSLYLVNVWIFALAEDAFEKPAFSFPFYFCAGLLISNMRSNRRIK